MAKKKHARDLLREWMRRGGHTQAALAERIGASQPTINKWVRGVGYPSLRLALALEQEAGIPAESWE